MSHHPAITVLMAAYNAEHIISASIQAILDQDFTDFEFIIINDGSTDGTLNLLNAFAAKDARIKIIDQANTGLTKALNFGLLQAQGEFIARIDADDIALPNRLSLQHSLMKENKDIILSGGDCISIYPQGGEVHWGYMDEATLRWATFLKTPFAHSTAMFRKDAALRLGGYDESFITAQDMECWMRMTKAGRVVMLDHPLIRRHITGDAISVKRRWRQFYDAMRARWRHNSWGRRPYALYYGCRSMLINLLPESLVMRLTGKKNVS